MKFKSETKQIVIYLKNRFNSNAEGKTVLQNCNALGLNYDMVCRALLLLHVKQVIHRDGRGPNSFYIIPTSLGLGDVIEAVEGINLEAFSDTTKQALNSVTI